MNDFLSTPAGRAYLNEEYNTKHRSTHEIAAEQNTYPNRIRRALKGHGYALRSKADAQKAALKSGRHSHPTKGEQRTPETRQKISDAIRQTAATKKDETPTDVPQFHQEAQSNT